MLPQFSPAAYKPSSQIQIFILPLLPFHIPFFLYVSCVFYGALRLDFPLAVLTKQSSSNSDTLDMLRGEQAADLESHSNSGKKSTVSGTPDASEAGGDFLHADIRDEDAAGGDVGYGNKNICSPPSQKMVKEPNTSPISQQQLVLEVKGIYAGLAMVESKCIEVENAQSSNNQPLSNEQWQALVALHRTLLHEHHDFLLASQHPSASSALRRLPHKYSMPARMWRHGIHSFLELLRHKLPASLDHMLSFIYLSYSILALLYETIPAFSEIWTECLGDLCRYCMVTEDDVKDREVWTGLSRHWYTKASDKNPTTGRLYHHLAILSRPNALQQLFFYSKALSAPIPFKGARESVLTLFDPILGSSATWLQAIDAAFIRIQGILVTGKSSELYEPSIDEFCRLLDTQIGRTSKKWLESG
jgi:hypothetical protein